MSHPLRNCDGFSSRWHLSSRHRQHSRRGSLRTIGMALLLALLIAHQAYTMPLRALPARVARETASFSTTAEASIVASFQPLLAERLAAWAVVPMGQTGYRRFRRCARCVGVRAPPRSGRGRPSGWDAGDCESSGAVRATQCAQGDDAMRAAAEDLVALPLAIARAVHGPSHCASMMQSALTVGHACSSRTERTPTS